MDYDDACIIANKWTVYNYVQSNHTKNIIAYDGAGVLEQTSKINSMYNNR